MVLYKLYVFCSGMKFKMAATAGLSLTLDPMGKMFQNASSLKSNCLGMIIGRSSRNFMFFMPIGNPTWPPQAILVSDWLISKKLSPLKPLVQMNRNLVGSSYGRSSLKIANFS